MSIKRRLLSFTFVFVLGTTFTLGSSFTAYGKKDGEDDTSEYVYYDALKNAGKESYKTAVVDMGKIEQRASVTATPYYPKSESVTVPMELGSVIFKKILVKRGDKVKKGTPVVKLTTKIDKTNLEEKSLELKRLEDVYQNFSNAQSRGLREQEQALNTIVDKLDKKVARAEYKKAKVVFEMSKRSQLRQIERCRDEVSKIKTEEKTTELLAPIDGYVESVEDLKLGTEIDHSITLVKMIDPTTVLFKIPDKNLKFRYNMRVTLKEESAEGGENKTISGKIISSYLMEEDENARAICYVKPDHKNLKISMEAKKYKAEVNICTMNNVLVIPKNATESETDEARFHILPVGISVGGNLSEQMCLIGLDDDKNYQVITGLDKGTKIILRN